MLLELYRNHKDRAAEIIYIRNIASEKYLEELANVFEGTSLTLPELYRLAFGNYYETASLSKRPLAKFTKDIAKGTGMLDIFE